MADIAQKTAIVPALAILFPLTLALSGCKNSSTDNAPSWSPGPNHTDIVIDTTQSLGNSNLSLGEESDSASYFNSVSTPARISALSPKWFRIHCGEAYGPILPEVTTTANWTAWDFTQINAMVDLGFASGATPVMNVQHAPRSLWTCTT